jgi:hypothetical protein
VARLRPPPPSAALRPRVSGLLVAVAASLLSRSSHADSRTEREVRELQSKAVEEDSLNVDYAGAIKKLSLALAKCRGNKCSAGLRAELLRDLGAMEVLDGSADDGRSCFEKALAIDPTLSLNQDYSNPQLQRVWAEVQHKVGDAAKDGTGGMAAGASVRPLQPAPDDEASAAPAPVADAKKCTPGSPGCKDPAPADDKMCHANDDCPSGACVDGQCRAQASAGATCSSDADCTGRSCEAGQCVDRAGGKGEACETDEQCPGGSCVQGSCTAAPVRIRRVWVGVWGSLDLAVVPAADQACLLKSTGALSPANTVGYYCVTASGADFPLRSDGGAQNASLDTNPKNGDAVNSGVSLGNTRVGASLDWAATDNLLVGVRVGYVLMTYPGQAAHIEGRGFPVPVHVEARGTYLTGDKAVANSLAGMGFVDAGVGEYDASVGGTVLLHGSGGATTSKPVRAWAVAGPVFAGVGLGVRALFASEIALSVALKFTVAFNDKSLLPVLGPEMGLQYGF